MIHTYHLAQNVRNDHGIRGIGQTIPGTARPGKLKAFLYKQRGPVQASLVGELALHSTNLQGGHPKLVF